MNYLTPQERAEMDALLTGSTSSSASGGGAGVAVSYADFKRLFWRNYQDAPHQQAIERKLEQVARYLLSGGTDGIGRLMIFMPPRHGKTQNVSRFFPAWLLGQNPDLRLILASYGSTLAQRNSRFIRNLIDTDDYRAKVRDIRLASGSAAADIWDIEGYNGGAIAVGVGGGITGHGGNLIVIDDPVKSRAEAESETFRQRAIDWYVNDLLTRLEEPGGALILMMTRWHTHDLAGYILDSEPGEWDVLALPALALDDDPLGRQPGEALWAARYPVAWLEKRRAQGEYAFASLYQQSPLPAGGRLFDTGKISVRETAPPCNQVVRFYDLAVTAKRRSDYTVGLKLGVLPGEQFVVYDVYRAQREFPDVKTAIKQTAVIDGKGVRIRLETEKAGIIGLQELLRDPDMRAFALDGVPPEGDKYSRALPVADRVNAGQVSVVKGDWNRAFLDELSVFPVGEHDDQVDALSGAYSALADTPDWDYQLA